MPTPFVVSFLRRCWSELLVPRIAGCIALHLPGNPCPRAVSGWQRRNLGVLLDRCHEGRDRLGLRRLQWRVEVSTKWFQPQSWEQVILRGMWRRHWAAAPISSPGICYRDHSRNMEQHETLQRLSVHWKFKAIREKLTRDSNSFPARCFLLDTVCIDFQKENNTAVDKSCNFHLVFSEILLQLRYR